MTATGPEVGERAMLEFLHRYRDAFEDLDAVRIAAHFACPCHITADGPRVTLSLLTRDSVIHALGRLIGAYRAIDVHSAEILGVQMMTLTDRLGVAGVRWRLLDSEDEPIYDFGAVYVLADLGDGMRITALAHDERPQLHARPTGGSPRV